MPKPTNSSQYQVLRNKLVAELLRKGISDKRVLQAIGQVPRHLFIDSVFLHYAYKDKAFPIGAEQTISQPYTVAHQSELLGVKAGDKILEVGTGSGYQAAVLVALGAKVYTIERQHELFIKTQRFLPEIGYRPYFYYGDGYKGLPEFAPFDGIIITAGAPHIPKELLKQLKVGARMVIPLGNNDGQKMTVITRLNEKDFERRTLGKCAFVPMLEGVNA